jgi:hypothetical protein
MTNNEYEIRDVAKQVINVESKDLSHQYILGDYESPSCNLCSTSDVANLIVFIFQILKYTIIKWYNYVAD